MRNQLKTDNPHIKIIEITPECAHQETGYLVNPYGAQDKIVAFLTETGFFETFEERTFLGIFLKSKIYPDSAICMAELYLEKLMDLVPNSLNEIHIYYKPNKKNIDSEDLCGPGPHIF
tara:strand:- start:35659 stop:36012 length:354 start_codon:yes stop_codon:yes gene_type:complete